MLVVIRRQNTEIQVNISGIYDITAIRKTEVINTYVGYLIYGNGLHEICNSVVIS